jgi:hypothetical protein
MAQVQVEQMETTALGRMAPWLARFALGAAGILLLMISGKFIADPAAAAAGSGMRLVAPVAFTNMRASFGAFPLGCALIAFASLRFRHWYLSGLSTVAAVLASALIVRAYGVLIDGTFPESRTVLIAEAVMLTVSLAAIASERAARRVARGDRGRTRSEAN